MSDNMVSAIRSIIDRINGQRSSVIGHSQLTATNDQQGVHLFFDAASPEKHVFPGLILFYGTQWLKCFPDGTIAAKLKYRPDGISLKNLQYRQDGTV